MNQYNINNNGPVGLIEEHIRLKQALKQARINLVLGKLFYSDLGSNLMEEGLYEKIGLF